MSAAGVWTEEQEEVAVVVVEVGGNKHVTIYTSSSGLKKTKRGERRRREKKYTHRQWAVRAQLIGLIGGNGMNAGVRWPCVEEGEGESPPTITLPSSDSFARSQSGPELFLFFILLLFIYSSSASVVQHFDWCGVFINLNIYVLGFFFF